MNAWKAFVTGIYVTLAVGAIATTLWTHEVRWLLPLLAISALYTLVVEFFL